MIPRSMNELNARYKDALPAPICSASFDLLIVKLIPSDFALLSKNDANFSSTVEALKVVILSLRKAILCARNSIMFFETSGILSISPKTSRLLR